MDNESFREELNKSRNQVYNLFKYFRHKLMKVLSMIKKKLI